jgi:hypothetical protein
MLRANDKRAHDDAASEALFDYSEAEWIEICSAIQKVRRTVPKKTRELLNLAGFWYRESRSIAERWGQPGHDDTPYEILKQERDHIDILCDYRPRVRWQDAIRIGYYRFLLSIWTDLVRGPLKFSRHHDCHKPQGALIDFLHAVTGPVMGAEAPSLESLADAIKRERRRRGHGERRSVFERTFPI